MSSVVIDGTTYVPVANDAESLRIVIVDNRGLTFVGYCSFAGDSGQVTIRDAQCIICWGTSEHLAEIAADGPRAGTKLGRKRTFTARRENIIGHYDCCEDKWNGQ